MQKTATRPGIGPSRRRKRNSPFHSVRMCVVSAGGHGFQAPAGEFPGTPPASPAHESSLWVASLLLALLAHALVVALLFWSSQWVVTVPVIEKVIPIELMKLKTDPAPVARPEHRPITPPQAKPTPPAPRAPRAINRAPRQAPSVAHATAPTVTPPTVTDLAPQAIAMREVADEQTPREVQDLTTQRVQVAGAIAAVPSQNTTLAEVIPPTDSPNLRTIEEATLSDTQLSEGPTAVDTDATATEYSVTDGGPSSLLREGITSDRDVIGIEGAAPLPYEDKYEALDAVLALGNVNATGSGEIGVVDNCLGRPEVREYTDLVSELVRKEGLAIVYKQEFVHFSIKLDTDGSVRDFELRSHNGTEIGVSILSAVYKASPFPPMPEAARCLADKRELVGTYKISPKE
jgi:hypothetical protein